MRAPEAPSLPRALAGYTLGAAAGLGWTNTVYTLRAPGWQGFFRAPVAQHHPRELDWAREGALLTAAGSLAAPVLFLDWETGRLATEACPGRPLDAASLGAGPRCRALGQQLRQLHALPYPKNAEPFHPARYALSCLQRAGAQGSARTLVGRVASTPSCPTPFAVTASPTMICTAVTSCDAASNSPSSTGSWPAPGTRASNS